ncbi:hypothetical protein MJO28_004176 [Puccinia striiformis f. sp. tritici]|uniref:Uncharacterized protein n=1 Tax=Puccinia striiformis f. sp. tritici TaxID=168172 RepID=A0ACC0ENU6_9BASI|nr:hypothetical protein MJO28_004176 [Puccinia striiformis f. sp. tritici]
MSPITPSAGPPPNFRLLSPLLAVVTLATIDPPRHLLFSTSSVITPTTSLIWKPSSTDLSPRQPNLAHLRQSHQFHLNQLSPNATNLNLAMSASEATDPVTDRVLLHIVSQALVRAFNALSTKCYELQDEHSFGKEREEVPTEEEVRTRMGLLNEVQTTLLPSSRQQLLDLLESLDVAAKDMYPNPKLTDALEIVSKLDSTLERLSFTANTLAPAIYSIGRASSRIDHTYGILKKERCDSLRDDVTELLSNDLNELFTEYAAFIKSEQFAHNDTEQPAVPNHRSKLIASTEKITQDIVRSIDVSQRSDFGYLQDNWHFQEKELGRILASTTQRVNESAGTADAPTEGFQVRPRAVQLMEKFVPLIKTVRILYKKLLQNPPFTFGEQQCSADIRSISRTSAWINNNLVHIFEYLTKAYESQQVENSLQSIPREAGRAQDGLNDSLNLIRTHLVPLDARSPDEIYNDLFSPIQTEFPVALENFLAAFRQFNADVPAPPAPDRD